MLKIYWDNDVFIDLISLREPWYKKVLKVAALGAMGKTANLLGNVAVFTTFYILNITPSRYENVISLLNKYNFKVICNDAQTLFNAIALKYKDFEEAVQCFTAVKEKADIFMTRNIRHFKAIERKLLNNGFYKKLELPKNEQGLPVIPEILKPKEVVKRLETYID